MKTDNIEKQIKEGVKTVKRNGWAKHWMMLNENTQLTIANDNKPYISRDGGMNWYELIESPINSNINGNNFEQIIDLKDKPDKFQKWIDQDWEITWYFGLPRLNNKTNIQYINLCNFFDLDFNLVLCSGSEYKMANLLHLSVKDLNYPSKVIGVLELDIRIACLGYTKVCIKHCKSLNRKDVKVYINDNLIYNFRDNFLWSLNKNKSIMINHGSTITNKVLPV